MTSKPPAPDRPNGSRTTAPARPRRAKVAFLLVALALVAWSAFSIRRVGSEGHVVRDSPILRVTPALLDPVWHFVPRGLFRLYEYPAQPAVLTLGQDEPLSFVTSEGATILGSVRIDYSVDAARVARLHAACGGNLSGWLAGLAAETLEGVMADRAHAPLARARVGLLEEAGARLLGEKASPEGLRIASLRFERLGYQGSDLVAAGPRAGIRRKVLWLAIDSFDWAIIDPLIAAGRMPRMAGLVARGARGDLRAFPPVLSPVIWTTVATGTRPEKHGIVDFVATDPETGAVLPVTSTLRRVRAFWNILGDAGVTVGVIAWWASFPAEPVSGFMATDRIAYQLFAGRIKDEASDDPLKTHPGDLYARVAPLIVRPNAIADREVERFIDLPRHASRFTKDDESRVNEFRTVLASARTYTDIGMALFAEHPTDLRVIYFEGPDTASHLFMPFVEPAIPSVPAEKAAWFGGVVPEFYVYQDELIGRFLDAYADEETTIIVSSDHGFRTGADRPDEDSRISGGKAALWHEKDGMVLFAGKDINPGARILGATVLDLLPTLLALYEMPVAQDMDGKVLTAALRPEFLAAHPPQTIATYETAPRRTEPRLVGATEDAQELLAKLESLGYVQQDKPTAHVNQGTIHLQAGAYEVAVASFRAALSQTDRDPIRLSLVRALRLAGRLDEADEQLALLRSRSFSPSSVQLETALVARDRGDLDAAEKLLRQAADADPNSAEAMKNLGLIHERRKQWSEAVAAYREAIARQPGEAEGYNKLGVALRQAGRADEAIEALRRAIAVDPDLTGPYNNLGLIYRERGEAAQARQVLETGLTMAPRSAVLLNSLGSLMVDAGNVDGGIAAFEKALSHNPKYAEALSNLAVIHSQRREAGKTIAYLARLIEVEPANADARLSLAMALLSEGRAGEAVGALRTLLEREPDNLKAIIMLGEIQLRDGKPREAVALLEKAAKLDAGIARVWNRLAQCYVALDRPQDARRALERSLGLDPDQPEVAKRHAARSG